VCGQQRKVRRLYQEASRNYEDRTIESEKTGLRGGRTRSRLDLDYFSVHRPVRSACGRESLVALRFGTDSVQRFATPSKMSKFKRKI